MSHQPSPDRYESMPYRRCGRSGLKLPALSLGLWHNFGGVDVFENSRAMIWRAFDLGITHFDLANNYGPPPGSAEETLGRVLTADLSAYRDELILSTKAGYHMWKGPYGEWGSRKYLLASLDQSLHRMQVPYVDIFYHHRPDPDTPLEESLGALVQAVRSGKALYAGISNYPADLAAQAAQWLRSEGVPLLIHQPRFHLLDRGFESSGLSKALVEAGVGAIAFCPLAQGVLTDRYLEGIAADSRASKAHGFLKPQHLTDETMSRVRVLQDIARRRGQSLAQMALSWVLSRPGVTSALIGASRVSQIEENVGAATRTAFTDEETKAIDDACALPAA